MTKDEIPDFVETVIATGCEMCAISTFDYVFGDADLTVEHRARIRDEVARINAIYGKRDHLKSEIIAYLRSIGRVYELSHAH